MVSADKQYEHVCAQIIELIKYSRDAFKTFLQLFSAIVGGSIWLSLIQKIPKEAKNELAILSTVLAALVALATMIFIVESLRAWYGYRKAQARLDADNPEVWRIPPPRLFPAALEEATMIILMIAAVAIFAFFNPFALAN